MQSHRFSLTRQLRWTALATGLGMALASTGTLAQSTTGGIFGQVPAATGETVTVTGSTGITRKVPVDASGRYSVNNLPLGTYTVTLQKDGAAIDSRDNVSLTVGAGTEVSFIATAGTAKNLEGVSVSASSLPPIDVSSVDTRTVITSAQLARLPLGRNAEAIALLAPGAVSGNGAFGRTVSFGGSGVTENAYYINGYNTSDPLKNLGGVGMPYGAIDQQEVYTGGYSAMYGRSDGGVISQVGKRGTNDWHGGFQLNWSPKSLASSPENIYYPNAGLPAGYGYINPKLPGTIYRNRDGNKSWDTTYSGYLGGPLIKDKLFLFMALEAEKQEGKSTSTSAASVSANTFYTYDLPKYYAKLDWNITDSNIFELTTISNKTQYSGALYAYDYATGESGAPTGSFATSTKLASNFYIGKYTSYLTDDLTLSATYGVSNVTDYGVTPGLSTTLPYLSGVTSQNPAYFVGGQPIRNGVPTYVATSPDAGSKTHGLRIDLEYQLGDHQLTGGIDNMTYEAHDEGQAMGGPGYAWIYSKASNPAKPLVPVLGVGAPGGQGYYVSKYIFSTTTSMSVEQKAQYIEDRWQVNDKLLLSLGLRNDRFTNKNNVGAVYVESGNQWAPRLGFSWDVLGDSSTKVFGNLGRYYLALPNSVAIRGASASTFTYEYFTYSGIDATTGAPTGLTPIGPGPVSSNNEYGQAPDAKAVTANDLKSQYQDEAILGFSKMLGPSWVTGAKLTLRKLQTAIDDVCDTDKLAEKAESMGINTDTVTIPGCVIFNPGKTNTFLLHKDDGTGYDSVTMTTADWGFTSGAKRKYYALDLFLDHPFDGKWSARLDYTFSRLYGNTEGQVKSDLGQDDVSKTQDWDAAALMEYSNGVLANDRTHQIKARGSYQITPEWMVSGVLSIQSGAPKECLGYFGTNEADPIGYKSGYHWCNGMPSRPGDAGRNPWTKKLDLGVSYRPAFANHQLAFGLNVFNVLNERKPTYTTSTYETSPYTVSNTYGVGSYFQAPRYTRLYMSYDF